MTMTETDEEKRQKRKERQVHITKAKTKKTNISICTKFQAASPAEVGILLAQPTCFLEYKIICS